MSPYLKPPLGHEEIVLDALLAKLLGHVQAHGAVLVVQLALGVVVEDRVGIVDLLKLLRRLRIIWILVRVVLQRQFPYGMRREERTFMLTSRRKCG